MYIAIELSLYRETVDACLGYGAGGLSQFNVGVQAGSEAVLSNVEYFLTLSFLGIGHLHEFVTALQFEVRAHHRTNDGQSRCRTIEGSGVGLTTGLAQ